MMLLERLRDGSDGWTGDALCVDAGTAAEAAAEIECLTAENERLKAARDATIRTLGDSRTPLQSRVNDAIGILARTP